MMGWPGRTVNPNNIDYQCFWQKESKSTVFMIFPPSTFMMSQYLLLIVKAPFCIKDQIAKHPSKHQILSNRTFCFSEKEVHRVSFHRVTEENSLFVQNFPYWIGVQFWTHQDLLRFSFSPFQQNIQNYCWDIFIWYKSTDFVLRLKRSKLLLYPFQCSELLCSDKIRSPIWGQ